jgi:aminopeptidase N
MIGTCGDFAEDDSLDPAYRALSLTLPAKPTSRARSATTSIPTRSSPPASSSPAPSPRRMPTCSLRLYDGLADGNAFSPDAASAGRRALRNVLLDYLSVERGESERAERQFRAASNMTDRAAALTVLAHRFPDASASRGRRTGRFRAPLPATISGPGQMVPDPGDSCRVAPPLERCRGADPIPPSRSTNPNRVRSLSAPSPAPTRRASIARTGRATDFWRKSCSAIDKHNSAVWRRGLPPHCAHGVRLNRHGAEGARGSFCHRWHRRDLSIDVRDIVERTLG